LEATETKYISLEKLILMELEINRRDLTNRVCCDEDWTFHPELSGDLTVHRYFLDMVKR
jgi:hypothetical protein